MLQYIIRRVLLLIPALMGVSLIVTAIARLLPGDAVDILTAETTSTGGPQEIKVIIDELLIEEGVDPLTAGFAQRDVHKQALIDEELERMDLEPSEATDAERVTAEAQLGERLYKDGIRAKIGLDKNYIEQWWSWTFNAVQGDLGVSIFGNRSVSGELRRRIPASAELGIFAMAFSIMTAVPVGVIAAVKQDTKWDYLTRSIAVASISMPSFVIATAALIIPSRLWDYSFPVFYRDLWESPGENLELMIIPAMILGLALSGSLMRLTRAQMLDVMRQDYIRTAQAKGLKPTNVVVAHALRNAFIPIVTVIGLQVPVLVGGSLVIEQIFGLPGVALYLFQAIALRDFAVIIGVNMAVALTIMMTNLVVDVTYGVLDPRIRLG